MQERDKQTDGQTPNGGKNASAAVSRSFYGWLYGSTNTAQTGAA